MMNGLRQGGGWDTPDPHGPSGARQLLAERYAREDLTEEEYRDRIRVLGEGT
jgi:putative membrane protein